MIEKNSKDRLILVGLENFYQPSTAIAKSIYNGNELNVVNINCQDTKHPTTTPTLSPTFTPSISPTKQPTGSPTCLFCCVCVWCFGADLCFTLDESVWIYFDVYVPDTVFSTEWYSDQKIQKWISSSISCALLCDPNVEENGFSHSNIISRSQLPITHSRFV